MNPDPVTVKIDDARIRERMRDMLADAWDEGFNDGCHFASADLSHATYKAAPPANPYRETGDGE